MIERRHLPEYAQRAHETLDRVAAGEPVTDRAVIRALQLTGDLVVPNATEFRTAHHSARVRAFAPGA